MATINYFIQSNTATAGIYVRLREGRAIDVKAKTNLIVDPQNWDKATGGPKSLKNEIGKALNEQLVSVYADLLKHYNKTPRAEVTTQWLKDFINPPIQKPNPEPPTPKEPKTETVDTTATVINLEQETPKVVTEENKVESTSTELPEGLTEYIDHYIDERDIDLEKDSITKLETIRAFIEKFEIWVGQKFLVKDVNKAFRKKFIEYATKESYAQNTYARYFKYLKCVCYDARDNGVPFSKELNKKLTIKNLKVEHIHLNFQELDILEKTVYNDASLDNARDWLLISCETGQRVSDFLKFHSGLIRIEKNFLLIEFTQKKTKKIMSIPLSARVKRILKKRGGNFPYKLSDQRYNEHIKKVCEYAGFTQLIVGGLQDPKTNRKVIAVYPKWKLVSSHIGRRSFATNYYGIIPTPLLMDATGHTTEKAFLVYIGKTNTDRALHLAQLIDATNKTTTKKKTKSNKKITKKAA